MNKKEYMNAVAGLGCIITGAPAQLHHPRSGKGMAERGDDWNVIPLSHDLHVGERGIHGDRTAFLPYIKNIERSNIEWELRAMVAEKLAKVMR